MNIIGRDDNDIELRTKAITRFCSSVARASNWLKMEVIGSVSCNETHNCFSFLPSPVVKKLTHFLLFLFHVCHVWKPKTCSLFNRAENGVLGNALKDGMLL